ncbi:MAG: carboxy terminal-processing peptidase [Bacteroidota bacterium]
MGLVIFMLSAYATNLNTNTDPVSDDFKRSVLFKILNEALKGIHFAPKDVNDDLSQKAHTEYIQNLDYSKRFFLQKDVDELNKFKEQLDDQFKGGEQEFFELSVQKLETRIGQVEGFYEKLLKKPFDFTENEEIELEHEDMSYASDEKELKDKWHKYLKYQTLARLVSKLERQEKSGGEEEENKTFKELEEESRKEVLKSQSEFFHRLNKFEEKDWLTMYINSITDQFDPHTSYFPPKDKENFDIQMSGQLEGIGATLSEKEGYITVNTIVPGSACWRQGDLEVGDRITKVAQGKGEFVDIVDARVDDAVKLIRGKKGSEVRLTVLKADDTEQIIPIIRDVVILEATYAKSALLGEDKDIGYIKLPSFYAPFGKQKGRSSGEDMRKEVLRLKKQNVEGIIIDLRNNGGGSLYDVVDIAGLFIEDGPVVQIKDRYKGTMQLDDKDKKVVYDGPLVILVNAYSASASEILAAAMQDYGRALIVGTDSATFGKGSVQRFYDLDQFVRGNQYESIKPLGSLKMTMQKFYRINGGATQLRGVTPDIQIPNPMSLVRSGERERETAMAWDKIEAADYDMWEKEFPITDLKAKSASRISGNPTFELVSENANWLKERRDERTYSLNLDTFRKEKEAAEKLSNKYKTINDPIEAMQASALPDDLETYEQDSVKADVWKKWQKSIHKDPYLFETTLIMEDLIVSQE